MESESIREDTIVSSPPESIKRSSSPKPLVVPCEGVTEVVVKKSSVTTVLVAGIALFSDGYTGQIGECRTLPSGVIQHIRPLILCLVGYLEPLFGELYPDFAYSAVQTRLSNSFLVGQILGMLFFGVLIDRMGRRTGVTFATVFLVLGIALSTAASGTSREGMFWMMVISRGVAGFGAGGEYPTCTTGATEAADETEDIRKNRGVLMALSTIFSIDLGSVTSGVVTIIVLVCYGQVVHEGIWRVCFGLGLVLPPAVFIYRFRMINSTQYRKHAIKKNIPYAVALKMYWKPMLGACMAWFFYDFIRFPFGLFSSTIIRELNSSNTLLQNIGFGALVNSFYLPGTILGGYLMDRIGRKQTMTLGFTCLGIMGFIIGGALYQLIEVFPLFIVLYGLFNASGEMGPGAATFVCASESFPTPLRGHFVGLAAAVGKVGAVIGTQAFTPVVRSFASAQEGQRVVFLIGSGIALVGALASWFLLPQGSRELEIEDSRFRQRLVSEGYDPDTFGEGLLANVPGSAYEAEEVEV
ncbi:hypothetical protein M426DRAFT_75360 [Hypoxylon sp. CI-4A]|nr:hypothetical protein M426DRAFT_75360 [Hypoxylon sp. CI-4A]